MAASSFTFDVQRPSRPHSEALAAAGPIPYNVTGLKTRGNAAFKDKNYLGAVKSYTLAIELAELADVDSDDANELPALLGNRSAAYLSLKQVNNALTDAERAAELAPTWAKGWFRLGNARAASGDLPGTMAAYTRSLAMEEEGADVRQTRNRLVERIFNLFLGMAVRRQLKPGEQPGIEDLEAMAHPEAIPILIGCFDVNDHSVQTAAAVQLAMLASSLDHKRDMLADGGALDLFIGILMGDIAPKWDGLCTSLGEGVEQRLQIPYVEHTLMTAAILGIANLLSSTSKDLTQQMMSRENIIEAVVRAASMRPKSDRLFRRHNTASSKAMECLCTHAEGPQVATLNQQGLPSLLQLCKLPAPPPAPVAVGEFENDKLAIEADNEQLLIYIEGMLIPGSALTGLAALCNKPGLGETVMAELYAADLVEVMVGFITSCAFEAVLAPIFRILTLMDNKLKLEGEAGGVRAVLSQRDDLVAALETLSALRPRALASKGELQQRRTEMIGPATRAEAKSLLRKLREFKAKTGVAALSLEDAHAQEGRSDTEGR